MPATDARPLAGRCLGLAGSPIAAAATHRASRSPRTVGTRVPVLVHGPAAITTRPMFFCFPPNGAANLVRTQSMRAAC